jgi:uncharacterized protein YceK
MKKIFIVLVLLATLLAGCTVQGETPKDGRFGMAADDTTIVTDGETGCKYLIISHSSVMSGVTPLYDSNGLVEGCKNIKK